MEASNVLAKMKGKHKKSKSKSKHHPMDTLKEEEESKPKRKLSREERKAKEEEEAKHKRFYLNVTYRQFLKYMKLLKVSEDELKEEIDKDHADLLRKYGAYIEQESEPEDDEDDDARTTTTSTTEHFTDAWPPWQITPREGTAVAASPKQEAPVTPKLQVPKKGPIVPKRGKSDLNLPALGGAVKPSVSKSPRGSRRAPPMLKTTPPVDNVTPEPLKYDDLGLPLVKSNTDLMDTLLSDSQAMLTRSRTTLSEKDSLHARSTPESLSRRSSNRRGSRHAFPNLTNLSSTSMSSKKRRYSVVPEPDWHQRKLSLQQKWADSRWMVVRDTKYSKEVERLRAIEQARKKGERIKNKDVPITCQRWQYVTADEDSYPLKFGVTYSGVQNPKNKKNTPAKKKKPPLRRMIKT